MRRKCLYPGEWIINIILRSMFHCSYNQTKVLPNKTISHMNTKTGLIRSPLAVGQVQIWNLPMLHVIIKFTIHLIILLM